MNEAWRDISGLYKREEAIFFAEDDNHLYHVRTQPTDPFSMASFANLNELVRVEHGTPVRQHNTFAFFNRKKNIIVAISVDAFGEHLAKKKFKKGRVLVPPQNPYNDLYVTMDAEEFRWFLKIGPRKPDWHL